MGDTKRTPGRHWGASVSCAAGRRRRKAWAWKRWPMPPVASALQAQKHCLSTCDEEQKRQVIKDTRRCPTTCADSAHAMRGRSARAGVQPHAGADALHAVAPPLREGRAAADLVGGRGRRRQAPEGRPEVRPPSPPNPWCLPPNIKIPLQAPLLARRFSRPLSLMYCVLQLGGLTQSCVVSSF